MPKAACDSTLEIERKFLVDADAYTPTCRGVRIRQAYIAERDRVSVRIRQSGDNYFLSIKSAIDAQQRHEFEYAVPPEHGDPLFLHCTAPSVVSKTRFLEPAEDGLVWEVDVFDGDNAGLVVAEIELRHVDQTFSRPTWLMDEVTEDTRYLNTELAKRPFTSWLY